VRSARARCGPGRGFCGRSETRSDAANAVIALARERYTKNLWSATTSGPKPLLVTVDDEDEEVRFVADRVLEARETGLALRAVTRRPIGLGERAEPAAAVDIAARVRDMWS
jgi:superfamily I DNA/RNA helicase